MYIYIYFKPGQIFRKKRSYVGQGECQTGHRQKPFLFLKKIRKSRVCMALETIWRTTLFLINIKLR